MVVSSLLSALLLAGTGPARDSPPDTLPLHRLDPITVTGTMKQRAVSDSPVKIEVIPAAQLRRSVTGNLTEALQYVNGLSNQVECGVCYTNGIRIHGMEGPYTAVLIDGMPIMSSLASVYGLNAIHPAFIERVEVFKGPSSTLHGSEAMAGVINVITKDPRFAPRAVVELSMSSDAEGMVDAAWSGGGERIAALLGASGAGNDRFVDRNGDGFSDFPLLRRGLGFARIDLLGDRGRPIGSMALRALHEDRFGGVEAWTPAFRGSDEVYGESVLTDRLEWIGAIHLPERTGLRAEGSWSRHCQNSWYGDTRYRADQTTAALQLLWDRSRGGHDLLLGIAGRLHRYEDDTPAGTEIERRWIPGIFLQDEVLLHPRLTLLGGARLDHHAEHGWIPSPRLAFRWDPAPETTLRLNAGTGFRVVNLFTEDHAALTGARRIVIAEALRPERSRSVTLNLNRVEVFGTNPLMLDLDLFHTRFSNRILADHDLDPRLIVYRNLEGRAISRGVAVAVNQNIDFDRLLWNVGVTIQEAFVDGPGGREDLLHAPRVRGTAGASWMLRSLPLRLDYTGTVTGPMRLPAYDPPHERPTRSPWQSLHNLQGTWSLSSGSELLLGVRNLLDERQPSPLVAPEDPFGEEFDTAYIYGPIRGRSFLLAFRHGIGR